MRETDDAFIANSNKINFESNSVLNSVQFVLQTKMDDYTYREFQNDAFQVSVLILKCNQLFNFHNFFFLFLKIYKKKKKSFSLGLYFPTK